MKDNYHPWDVDYDEFYRQKTERDRLRFLVRFAVLAPSSHNSQPWTFAIGEHEILLNPDFRRALPASDTDNRQLFISLGCAVENLLVAAEYFGYKVTLVHFPYGETERPAVRILCIRIQQEPLEEKNHLIFSIPRRRTNRNKYDERLPPENFLSHIKNYGNEDIQVIIVRDQTLKARIADIVGAALIKAMDDKAFRSELSRYLKANFTRSKVGMTGSGFGIPTPLSFIAPFMIRYINVNRLSQKKDDELLKRFTPVFILIATRNDTKKDWIQSGQLYERIALEAESKEMNCAPMAAAIQVGTFYSQLKNILNITFRPQIFFRIGYATYPAARSPRLSAEDTVSRIQ